MEMMNFSKRTTVKRSEIDGLGLFARIPISKGYTIVRYLGDIIDGSQFDATYGKDGLGTYVVGIGDRVYLDATRWKSSKGRYANDARNTRFANNARMVTRGWDLKTYLVAERNIHRGEEILVSYGERYWSQK